MSNTTLPIRPIYEEPPIEIRHDSTGLVLLRRGQHRDQMIVLTPQEIERLRVIIS